MSRKKKRISVWQALNEPVVEVTDEAARHIFLVAAVMLLMVWLVPSFGSVNVNVVAEGFSLPDGNLKVSATSENYHPLFAPYEEVAGAVTSPLSPPHEEGMKGEVPQWYYQIATTGASLGDFYHETVTQPFAQAAVELFDISQPVQAMTDFLKPGTDAAWNAWVDLIADTQL